MSDERSSEMFTAPHDVDSGMHAESVRAARERTDVHRPAEFDPADYRVIDYLDNKRPEYHFGVPLEVYENAVAVWRSRIEAHFPGFRTDGAHGISQCNHCGHPGIRWVAVVEHAPTGDKLAFGEICADRCELSGRDAFRAKFIKTRAEREAAAYEKAAARAKFEAENADVVGFLASINDDYDSREPDFLLSVKRQLGERGSLSEAQVAAVRKFKVKRDEFAAKREAEKVALADAPPLEEGRREVTGTVRSTKWHDSDYGSAVLRMLVEEPNGNRVYGTVPESLWKMGENGSETVEAGDRVAFTAAVTRSRDDEHFGYYKRPTKARYVEGQ